MRIYPAHRDNATLGRLTWRAVPSLDTRSWGIIATSACVGLRIETTLRESRSSFHVLRRINSRFPARAGCLRRQLIAKSFSKAPRRCAFRNLLRTVPYYLRVLQALCPCLHSPNEPRIVVLLVSLTLICARTPSV